MPYILNKTDGSIVATVQDASLDLTTDLTFVGRNYAGYGEVQNENFLKLLENFSSLNSPSKPIEGQLWFDKNSDNKKLNVYDGNNWKTVANLEISEQQPVEKVPREGDLWYDPASSQLHVFDGRSYVLIGPAIGADTQAGWRGDADAEINQLETRNYNSKAVIGAENDVIAIVSAREYQVSTEPADYTKYRGVYQKIYRGITLNGVDSNGSSESQGIYFWGSSSHSLRSNLATTSSNIISVSLESPNPPNYEYSIPMVSSKSGSSQSFTHLLTYNPFSRTLKSGIFDGIATKARYADLAERYHSDISYEPGTVVVIGGEQEITVSTHRADTSVAGVISQNPAYMMNSEAGDDTTHPYVALKGRVPCFVTGKIRKGDLLVTSDVPGHAEVAKPGDSPNAVFAKALEDFDGDFGVIEVKV